MLNPDPNPVVWPVPWPRPGSNSDTKPKAMFNNEPTLNTLDARNPYLPIRQRKQSNPCLPDRLPNLAFIEREAVSQAPLAIIRQLRRSPSFSSRNELPNVEDQEQENDEPRKRTISSASSSSKNGRGTRIAKVVPPPPPLQVGNHPNNSKYFVQSKERISCFCELSVAVAVSEFPY